MKKTTFGLIFVAALLIKIPLANAQQKAFVFPQVADGVVDGGYYKTTFIILTVEGSTSVVTCGFVLYGLGVDLGDGKGLVTGWTATISPGIPYVSSSSADQPLHTGYATLSCTDNVRALVLYSSTAKDQTGSNLGAVYGSSDSTCSAFNTAYTDVNQQSAGSQLAFAIANNTTQPRTYWVYFSDNSPATKLTVPAQTSVAMFLADILPSSSNKVGWMGISPADTYTFGTGFSVIALRYTGAAFSTIPLSCALC